MIEQGVTLLASHSRHAFGTSDAPGHRSRPTEEQAYALGAAGSPNTDAERLLFEAWMRGHCWAYADTWVSGKGYADRPGFDKNCVDPLAMDTRRLFAAWRDRAALAALCISAAPAPAPSAAGDIEHASWDTALRAGLPPALPACVTCRGAGQTRHANTDYLCNGCGGSGVQMDANAPYASQPDWKLHRCPDGQQCRAEIPGGCGDGWCGHFTVRPENLHANISAPAMNAKFPALSPGGCNTHPDAPHGFNRNASHNAGRYVCDCEGWMPPENSSFGVCGTFADQAGTYADKTNTFADPARLQAWEGAGQRVHADNDGIASLGVSEKPVGAHAPANFKCVECGWVGAGDPEKPVCPNCATSVPGTTESPR